MSQLCKIELQIHENTMSIRIIILSTWWRPSVYGYGFNFSLSSHNLSKFGCKSILENLKNQPI
jgi:hypothetical protein